MKSFNRAVVDEFAKDIEMHVFYNAYSLICQHINDTLHMIKQRNPLISDYNIYVANEVFSGQEYFASGLDIFIAFKAPQIELNYGTNPKSKLKNHLKYFWRVFKNNFSFFKSKKKKQEKLLKETERQVLSLKDYDVEILMKDLYASLTKILYNKTALQLHGNKILIIGEEEFGVEINIYPVFVHENDSYKLYNISSQKQTLIDFRQRFENIQIKNIQTSDEYNLQIKIFNNLYWSILTQKPNQIFIESLLYSCPNELFIDNHSQTTVNLLNYLKNTSMQKFISICDENTNLFDEPLNTTHREIAIKFLSKVKIE